jgi:hypothetical protein
MATEPTPRLRPQPRLQALVLAERVYTDKDTGQRVIAGTFNHIQTPGFPARIDRQAVVYVSLTDVRKPGTWLALRFVDTHDLSILMEARFGPLLATDPLETLEFAVPIPGFMLPHAGIYDLELHVVDGERLGSLRLKVHAQAAPTE